MLRANRLAGRFADRAVSPRPLPAAHTDVMRRTAIQSRACDLVLEATANGAGSIAMLAANANSVPAKVPHDHLPLAELRYRAQKAVPARRLHLPRRPMPTPAAPLALPRAATSARRLNFPLCQAARSLPGRKFGYPRALSNVALSVSPSRGFPQSLFSLSRKRRHPSLTASLPIMRLRRSTFSACSCAMDRSVRWRTVG
jgi:hypothetical protein